MVRNLIPTVELNLPATKKKTGFTQKDFENWIATRPSYKESDGAWSRFQKIMKEARKKDEAAEAKAKKKKSKILEVIEDHRIIYEKENATKAEVEAAHKRQDARDKKLEKKYYTKKPKPTPFPQSADELMNLSDWLEIIDPGGWSSPEDDVVTPPKDKKFVTKPVEENLHNIYMDMLQSGELLPDVSFEKFERDFLNLDIDLTKKVKKEIQKIADAKKRIEGLASLLGERTTDI